MVKGGADEFFLFHYLIPCYFLCMNINFYADRPTRSTVSGIAVPKSHYMALMGILKYQHASANPSFTIKTQYVNLKAIIYCRVKFELCLLNGLRIIAAGNLKII